MYYEDDVRSPTWLQSGSSFLPGRVTTCVRRGEVWLGGATSLTRDNILTCRDPTFLHCRTTRNTQISSPGLITTQLDVVKDKTRQSYNSYKTHKGPGFQSPFLLPSFTEAFTIYIFLMPPSSYDVILVFTDMSGDEVFGQG